MAEFKVCCVEVIEVDSQSLFEHRDFLNDGVVGFISLDDGTDPRVNFVKSLLVGSSTGISSFAIKPFTVLFQELDNFRNLLWFCEGLIGTIQIVLPLVGQRFQLVLLLICLQDHLVVVEHFAFDSEEFR